jgi:hypothetical protein
VAALIDDERRASHGYGGRSIFGWEPAMDEFPATARRNLVS